ncbi:hypothetical protein VNO78_01596 [Psophocarpus tetragonolobus]|uniref:Uncharacterized protein n=1 Tax=Psophocarpus tetragonolobus TaxID=3891 RepID=A0AAN9SY30_PSOTE
MTFCGCLGPLGYELTMRVLTYIAYIHILLSIGVSSNSLVAVRLWVVIAWANLSSCVTQWPHTLVEDKECCPKPKDC